MIKSLAIMRARGASGGGAPVAPDADQRALHIRCGTDIREALSMAGFGGDFLPFYDPYVHGPVPKTDSLSEFLRIRAEFISAGLHPNYDEVLADLKAQYAALDQARGYGAVYLWFEHDSYDQLILAKLLDFFREPERRPERLQVISVTHYPGVKPFIGLGQLPPEAMPVLWEQFTEVTPAQTLLGTRVWDALCSPTPEPLRAIIAAGTPELPTMAIALERHLQQLPAKRNGLDLSEHLTLRILEEKGGMPAGRLFGWYTNHYEPLPFMGDTGYWLLLEALANAAHPAIALEKRNGRPGRRRVTLREEGRRLLAGDANWIEQNGIDRWVGGIHLCSREGNVYTRAD